MGVGGKVLQLGAEAVIEGGQQFLKRMGKAKTLPKLSGITADTLVKHVDANKGVDIPDIETMFKGMVNGDEASYTAFDEFSSTTMVANKYQDNVSSYERATRKAVEPKQSIKSALFEEINSFTAFFSTSPNSMPSK